MARRMARSTKLLLPLQALCIQLVAFQLADAAAAATTGTISTSAAVKAAYWPSFAADRYPISSLNPHLFTHLTYAFADLDPTTFHVNPPADDDGNLAKFASTLRQKNPQILTLVAIGGGASNKTAFAEMARSPLSRQIFINSSIALARSNRLDGLDLDWEFPQSEEEMADLGTLFTEWRAGINAEAKNSVRRPLLLTAAVYYAATIKWVGGGTYPIGAINANLDWVGLMAFDYHGSWEPTVTGAHTALYSSGGDVSSDSGISKWLQAGLTADKAVLGLASYGRSWKLKNDSAVSGDTGIGAAAVGTPDDSTPFFADVVEFIRQKNATVVYDNATVTSYCFAENVWIGFDSPLSIANKVKYLKKRGLRGYFFWTASYDSSHWPLSNAAGLTLDSP